MSPLVMSPGASDPGSAEASARLRIATRSFKALVLGIVCAVAAPLFLHYTGFETHARIPGLAYPQLHNYNVRLTPGQSLNHGVDFSQIWLSAQKITAGEDIYYPVDRVQWRRKWSSTYHPLIHWLYIPLSKLQFQPALIAHNLFGCLLLIVCGGLALRNAGCQSAFPAFATLLLAAMYLTPTGLMHLERGQMDTYVAASVLCLVAYFQNGGRGWAIAAGLLSTLKVQAWIFVGFYWIVAAPLFGLRERNSWWVPAIIVGSTLLFISQVLDWIPSFLYVAENTSTHGPSFTRILSKTVSYGLPIASSFAVALAAFLSLRESKQLGNVEERRALLRRVSFPLAAALTIQTVCGTPVTHDYRLVAFLGLLPALAVWCTRADKIPNWLRHATAITFAATLFVSLRVRPFTEMGYEDTAYLLLSASVFFVASAAYLASAPIETQSAPDGATN